MAVCDTIKHAQVDTEMKERRGEKRREKDSRRMKRKEERERRKTSYATQASPVILSFATLNSNAYVADMSPSESRQEIVPDNSLLIMKKGRKKTEEKNVIGMGQPWCKVVSGIRSVLTYHQRFFHMELSMKKE